MVVLRHLGELLVLDDLQEPEAHGEREEHDDRADLQRGQTRPDSSTIFS
jgi:hypothetical protein